MDLFFFIGEKMNIAIFSENFSNYISGGRWYPWYIGYALAHLGHNIKLITNNMPIFNEEFTDFPNKKNVEVIVDKDFCSKKIRSLKSINQFIGSPIKGADYAVNIANCFKKKSIVLCYEPHNWIEGSIKANVESNSAYWEDYIKVAKACDSFICNAELPSMYAKAWIPEITNKVNFVYNGINSIVADKIPLVELKERENAIAYVGRMDAHKGITDIIEILAKSNIKKDLIFYMISGYVKEELKKYLEDNCKNLGIDLRLKIRCSTTEKFEILSRVKFLLMTSRFEGFGIPPAEAFYMNTPVVCYDLPIFKEVYKEHPYYIKMDDVENSAKKIDRLFYDYNDLVLKDINLAKEHVSSFARFDNFAKNFEKTVIGGVIEETKVVEEIKAVEETKVVEEIKHSRRNKRNKDKVDKKEKKLMFEVNKKVSFIVPLYNISENYIRQCFESLLSQTHKDIEIVVINDGDANIKVLLSEYKLNDRFKIVEHKTNLGIALSMNDGIKAATGDFIAFVDGDDLVSDRAAEYIAFMFENSKCDIVYTNECQIDSNGKKLSEAKKPDWSLELLMQCQYINHLTAYSKKFIEKILPCNKEYGRSWDYDLLLRASEKNPVVGHIPTTLYSWRIHKSNYGLTYGGALSHTTSLDILNKYIKNNKLDDVLEINPIDRGKFEHIHKLKVEPKALVIIPFVNYDLLIKCLFSIKRNTQYKNYDIITLYHNKDGNFDGRVTKSIKESKIVKYQKNIDGGYNFSKFNNDIYDEYGKDYDYIVLMNDDILPNTRWLTELIATFNYRYDSIGVVGAKLIYPNHKNLNFCTYPEHWMVDNCIIQHAGVELLKDHGASHIYKNRPSNWLAANYIKEYETVTFGLVAIDSECYGSVKLNEKYDADLNDMEFCIRAKRKGWRIFYTPWSVAIHLESITRRIEGNAGKVDNQVNFRKEFAELLKTKKSYRQMINSENEGL